MEVYMVAGAVRCLTKCTGQPKPWHLCDTCDIMLAHTKSFPRTSMRVWLNHCDGVNRSESVRIFMNFSKIIIISNGRRAEHKKKKKNAETKKQTIGSSWQSVRALGICLRRYWSVVRKRRVRRRLCLVWTSITSTHNNGHFSAQTFHTATE